MSAGLIPLSASRLAVLEKCSYLYYCQYIIKLPKETNSGSQRGVIVHALFECLLNPRHKHFYDEIIRNKSLRNIPVIDRFIRKQAKKEGLRASKDHKGQHNYDMIEAMALTGLQFDFFCEGSKLEAAETQFDYTNDKKTYRILGFIDKIAKSPDDKLNIWDYKTSANKFEGDDLEENVQAKMYSLYALRVRGMSSFVKFVFLRHPENPIVSMQFSENELNEFEKTLEKASDELSNFNLEKAYSNFAADQGFTNKGFKGRVICGSALSPTETKKDGKVKWSCSVKFGYNYFALCNEEGTILKTSKIKEDLVADELKGEYIIKKRFLGCPKFRHLEYNKKLSFNKS